MCSSTRTTPAPPSPTRQLTTTNADDETVERAPSGALLVTLALSSPEVEQVVFAAEFGHIWLTAENADADESGTRIVDLGEVYDDDGGGVMTSQALITEAWTPPASTTSSLRAATTVAVLGEDRFLAEQATAAIGPRRPPARPGVAAR